MVAPKPPPPPAPLIAAAEAFLAERPPSSEYWSSDWLKDVPNTVDCGGVEWVALQILVCAAIMARERGGAVRDEDILVAVTKLLATPSSE
jgi:hypothetical protein